MHRGHALQRNSRVRVALSATERQGVFWPGWRGSVGFARPCPKPNHPHHPFVTLAFLAMCVYMLYSSIDYIRNPVFGPKFGVMALAGLLVMLAGIPLYYLIRKK